MIIGLTGKAGCGKDTAAMALITRVSDLQNKDNWYQLSFAEPLKKALMVMFAMPPETFTDRQAKESPITVGNYESEDHFVITPRRLMQTLGVEWGRGCVSPNIWIAIAMDQAQRHMKDGHSIVISDVRFDNEAAAIKRMGGKIIHITRQCDQTRLSSGDANHSSECGISASLIDARIVNDGTIEDLADKMYAVIDEYR